MVVGYSFHGGDLFHIGHLTQLLECRKHCDYLIVGVLTDRALESYKRKPIIPYPWRAAIYEALRCVDRVVPQNSRDPTDNLKWLKPDVLFHGDDWGDIPGKGWMEEHGGKTITTSYFEPLSTTRIINEVIETSSDGPGARVWVHPSADISPDAQIGEGTRIWHQVQVREDTSIGCSCIIGKGVYIDRDVHIGHNVKIQNCAAIGHGVTIEDGVFVGPFVDFVNDKHPRAINPDGSLKTDDDWVLREILVRQGAAIGANTTIACSTIGRWAMVGAGSVVTRDVPDYGLVWGSPARLQGFVCPCGGRLEGAGAKQEGEEVVLRCRECGEKIEVTAVNELCAHS